MMKTLLVATLTLACLVGLSGRDSEAVTTCTFTAAGTTMTLDADCQTDTTILVPDGMTLDGAGHTITALDPAGGHFKAAVVRNGGASASIVNVTITTSNLANVCDAGGDRLRGIMLDGASGVISGNAVLNINQGPSGCQEGNAIEVRNFDSPLGFSVEISQNLVSAYQKTGIVVNGNVSATVAHNTVGVSNSQPNNIAANAIQIGFGATAIVEANHIGGNSWAGPSDYVATAVLLYQAGPGTVVRHNNLMEGNADVGIYAFADGVVIDNNRVFETGPDLNVNGYDIGIGNYGAGNTITNNKVRGYATPYELVTGGNNKVVPSPKD